ncbi:unnamed protein product [Prunus armeniaca]|nr:unnamed protein product [Prunus armeniaca]CAB4313222.1 unnamed protein product [Prunus armeniaca]
MVLCIGFHLQRRKKFVLSAGDGRTNSPNELLNFMIYNRPTDDFDGLQNDHGNMGRHALSIFSFASVLAATCNFSEDNKLGERGFGPDYKEIQAWELWNEGGGLELMDPNLGDSCIKDQFLRCMLVALLCVEENAADRPTMSDVISMLTSESMELAMPTKPAFYTERNVATAAIAR